MLFRETSKREVGGALGNELQVGLRALAVVLVLQTGKVQLADGRWESGFICEAYGLQGAENISHFGGWRASIGFAIGGGLGLLLGFITGLSKWGERFLDSSVQMIRNVPHLALIPLVILWFGIDESAKIFLVALGTLFPIYLNTYHGIRNVDPALVEMARSYGLSGFSLFRQVILPGALPSILVGVRFALGFMWLTLIVAETISASSGIGYLAMNAREFLQTDVVVLAILLYAVLGKLADVAARTLERIWLRWHPAYQVKAGGQ